MNTNDLTWSDFMKIEMRVGTILSAEIFEEAKKPGSEIKKLIEKKTKIKHYRKAKNMKNYTK
jgi:hypothetical protein